MWETFQEISDTHSTARARSPSHGCSARITRGTRDARVELGPCAPATRRTGRPRDGERGFDVFLLFMHEVLRGRTPSHAVVPECARSYLRGFPTYDLAREGTTARPRVRPGARTYDRAAPHAHGARATARSAQMTARSAQMTARSARMRKTTRRMTTQRPGAPRPATPHLGPKPERPAPPLRHSVLPLFPLHARHFSPTSPIRRAVPSRRAPIASTHHAKSPVTSRRTTRPRP